MSATFLEAMADSSRRRVHSAQGRLSYRELAGRIERMPAPPELRLDPRFDVFAEVKLRSPAGGATRPARDDLRSRIGAYATGGAAAVSVLTEPSRFDGSMDHLESASQELGALGIPAIRKDFIVDAYQLAEARAAGAGGALLILRLLGRRAIESLIETARGLRLFLLLEAFDEDDLALAQALIDALGPAGLLVGVNCRDLATLQVRPGRLLELADRLPVGVPAVAESGIGSGDDVRAVARAGYRVALVGTALMRTATPAAAVAAMIAAGRRP